MLDPVPAAVDPPEGHIRVSFDAPGHRLSEKPPVGRLSPAG
jgi:hypothetical protein